MPKDQLTEQEAVFQETEAVKEQIKVFEKMVQQNRSLLAGLNSFEAFNTKLKHLVDDLMTPYYLPDPFGKGTYKRMEPEVFQNFIETYNQTYEIMTKLQEEIQEKLNNRAQNQENNSFLMPLQETLKYAGNLMEKDIATLSGMNPKSGIVLPDVIKESRTRKLTINQAQIKTVGGNLSSRIPVTFTDEQGKEHKGFFTRDKIIHFTERTKNVMLQAIDKTNDPQELKDLMKQYLNTLFDTKEIVDDPEHLRSQIFDMTRAKASDGKRYNCRLLANTLATQGTIYRNQYGIKNLPEAWSFFGKIPKEGEEDTRTEQQKRNRAAYDKKFGRTGDKETYYKNLDAYFDILVDAVIEDVKQKDSDLFLNYKSEDQSQLISQMEGSSLYQRNSAMSAVANLLGIGHVVAHSENMTMTINGEQVQGIFMEQADGEDLGRVAPGSKLDNMLSYDKIKEPSLQATKDLFSIQVLDYICNNIDRHNNNVMYKVKDNQVIGLQGIDNDRSFGANVYESNQDLTRLNNALNLNSLLYVPKKLAKAIEQLNPKVLDLVLKGYQLSEAERKAAIARLNQVKTALNDMELFPQEDDTLETKHFLRDYLGAVKRKSPLAGTLLDFKKYINKGKNLKNAKQNEPINYIKAEYSKPADQPQNSDIIQQKAAHILESRADKASIYHSEAENLKKYRKEMIASDSQVKLGTKRFKKLEDAVQALETVYAKVETTIRSNHFRRKLPAALESELVTALYHLQTTAQVYLSGKKPDKKRNAAESTRYNSAVYLKKFAETRIDRLKNFSMLTKDPSNKEKSITYDQLKNYVESQKETYCKDGNQFICRKVGEELKQIDPDGFNMEQFTRTELRAVYMDWQKAAGPMFGELFNRILPEQFSETTYEEADRAYQFLKQHKVEADWLKQYAANGGATREQCQDVYNHLRKDYDPAEMNSIHADFESTVKAMFAKRILKKLTKGRNITPEDLETRYKQMYPDVRQGDMVR